MSHSSTPSFLQAHCCCVYPLPYVCVGGGESDHPDFGPPASISLHLASGSTTPAGSVHKSRGDSVVRMWVQLKRWCVWVLQRGHSGDGFNLASTLCKYELRKGDLFVLSWARVRGVRRESLSSELLMCGGGARSILLLLLVARCLDTIDVCIWRMFFCLISLTTPVGPAAFHIFKPLIAAATSSSEMGQQGPTTSWHNHMYASNHMYV